MTTAPEAHRPPAPLPPDRRRQRLLSYNTKNMIYSVLAVFALAFGVWALMPAEDAIQRRPVEVDSVAAYAVEQTGHPVWVPVDLPEGWQVTTVRLSSVAGEQTWRLGVVSPSEEFAVLSQAEDPGQRWQQTIVGEMASLGSVPLDGPAGRQQWEVWTGGNGTALVLPPSSAQPATTIVHGSADQSELAEFVAHLEPAS